MELKPCPFCGKVGCLRWDLSEMWIECTTCEARGEWFNGPKAEEEATNAWNTRHTVPEVAALVEACSERGLIADGAIADMLAQHGHYLLASELQARTALRRAALRPFQEAPDA